MNKYFIGVTLIQNGFETHFVHAVNRIGQRPQDSPQADCYMHSQHRPITRAINLARNNGKARS